MGSYKFHIGQVEYWASTAPGSGRVKFMLQRGAGIRVWDGGLPDLWPHKFEGFSVCEMLDHIVQLE